MENSFSDFDPDSLPTKPRRPRWRFGTNQLLTAFAVWSVAILMITRLDGGARLSTIVLAISCIGALIGFGAGILAQAWRKYTLFAALFAFPVFVLLLSFVQNLTKLFP
jgi:CHASE2 domain-containing sensor protein